MQEPFNAAMVHLQGESYIPPEQDEETVPTDLEGTDRELYELGEKIFSRDGSCESCHQADGQGLAASGFPPLAGTNWVLGDEQRLIKVVLKGLQGPIQVLGESYPGQVPMTSFGGMLSDKEVAGVLTYVRNSFGNEAAPVDPELVKQVRAEVADKQGFYTPQELLDEHPMEQ